uniref:Uncharacterized protein n=1 Tax=Arundo donax TaxID=35708 RepID=A0A0A9DBZ6_ARUDO
MNSETHLSHGEREMNPTGNGDLGDWRRRIRWVRRVLAELEIGGRVELTDGRAAEGAQGPGHRRLREESVWPGLRRWPGLESDGGGALPRPPMRRRTAARADSQRAARKDGGKEEETSAGAAKNWRRGRDWEGDEAAEISAWEAARLGVREYWEPDRAPVGARFFWSKLIFWESILEMR